MGKMKDKYIDEINEPNHDQFNADYEDYCKCNPDCGCKSIIQDESQAQHDAWWNNLTNEQKETLCNNQEELFELIIEEMNHDLSFGK